MDKGFWLTLDEAAVDVARQADLITLSLDGLFERQLRAEPTAVGVNRFIELAHSQIIGRQMQHIEVSLNTWRQSSRAYNWNGGFSPFSYMGFLELASESIGNHFKMVVAAYARRYRYHIASRMGYVNAVPGEVRTLNRSGQAIRSSDFVYLTARKAMLDAFNDAQVQLLSIAGHTSALIINRDSDHETDSTIISIDGSFEPSYQAAAETIFHPRSNSVIGGPG